MAMSKRKLVEFEFEGHKVKEAEVLAAVTAYLKSLGWRVLRTVPGLWVPYYEYQRAIKTHKRATPRRIHEDDLPDILATKANLNLWVEMKRPGARPTPSQLRMHRLLRAEGYTVVWCDGLHGGAEPFAETYEQLYGKLKGAGF